MKLRIYIKKKGQRVEIHSGSGEFVYSKEREKKDQKALNRMIDGVSGLQFQGNIFQLVIPYEANDRIEEIIDKSRKGVNELAIVLVMPDDGWAANFPWESMTLPFLGGVNLAANLSSYFYRQINSNQHQTAEPLTKFTTALVIFDAVAEKPIEIGSMSNKYRELYGKNSIGLIDVYLDKKISEIVAMLSVSQPEIVHLICHGRNKNGQQEIAIKDSETGHTSWFSIEKIAKVFDSYLPVLLICQFCESGGSVEDSSSIPLHHFALKGITNVIGFRKDITIADSHFIIGVFLENLVVSKSVIASIQKIRNYDYSKLTDDNKIKYSDIILYSAGVADYFETDNTESTLNSLIFDKKFDQYVDSISKAYIELPGICTEIDTGRPVISEDFSLLINQTIKKLSNSLPKDISQTSSIFSKILDFEKVNLIGPGGSGKTTTLLVLYKYYKDVFSLNNKARFPIYLDLNKYRVRSSIYDFIQLVVSSEINNIFRHKIRDDSVVLLLDGLNEISTRLRTYFESQLNEFLGEHKGVLICIASRDNDFDSNSFVKISIDPLSVRKIFEVCQSIFENDQGRTFFINALGRRGAHILTLCELCEKNGYQWYSPFAVDVLPEVINEKASQDEDSAFDEILRNKPGYPGIIDLIRNPFMLILVASSWQSGIGLPSKKQFFPRIVDEILEREIKIAENRQQVITKREIENSFACIAYQILCSDEFGTSISESKFFEICEKENIANESIDFYIKLTNIVKFGSSFEFTHQLFLSYFGAVYLRNVHKLYDINRIITQKFWESTGWSDAIIFFSQMNDDLESTINWILVKDPVSASRILRDSKSEKTNRSYRKLCSQVTAELIKCISSEDLPPKAKHICGKELGLLGDNRKGVSIDYHLNIPDILWIQIPKGKFLMGSDYNDEYYFDPVIEDDDKPRYFKNETPKHTVEIEAFYISKFLITNEQFEAFVKDDGYGERWNHIWSKEGLIWKNELNVNQPIRSRNDIPNYPRVSITFFEILAFCNWLTTKLQNAGMLADEQIITLPSEAQWEKAARGSDGFLYPWGNRYFSENANNRENKINELAAVGIFVQGESPYGVLDMSGNVWEWTRTIWGKSPHVPEYTYPYVWSDGREDIFADGNVRRVQKGGSFTNTHRVMRPAKKDWGAPYGYLANDGFRVIIDNKIKCLSQSYKHSGTDMSLPDLKITIEKEQFYTVIRMAGRLEVHERDKFVKNLRHLSIVNSSIFVFDTLKLEYMSMQAIFDLYYFQKEQYIKKKNIYILALDDRTRELFRLSGLVNSFQFIYSLSDIGDM